MQVLDLRTQPARKQNNTTKGVMVAAEAMEVGIVVFCRCFNYYND